MGPMSTASIAASTIATEAKPRSKWQERINALGNIPPVFRMVWAAAPSVVTASVLCRLIAALVPLGVLAVTKVIVDSITVLISHQTPLPRFFWWLVVLEFALATLAMTSGR